MEWRGGNVGRERREVGEVKRVGLEHGLGEGFYRHCNLRSSDSE